MNGKRYDAVTGSYLGMSLTPIAKPSVVHSIRGAAPKTIDGFRRVSRGITAPAMAPQASTKKPLPRTVPAPKNLNQTIAALAQPVQAVKPAQQQRLAHNPGASVAPHTPQKATTLMRSAVTKPVIKSPTMLKAQTRTDILAKVPAQTVVPKMSYNSIDPVRHRRAERMMQSPAISRYAAPSSQAHQTVYKVATPAQAISRPAPQAVAQVTAPAAQQFTDLRAAPRTSSRASNRSTNRSIEGMSRPVAAAPRPKSDIFEKALAGAKSHEEVFQGKNHRTKKRGRWLRYVTGSLVALLLVGFLAYHNASSLSLEIASYKAGLHAKMPTQKPAGFSFGYLDYQPGNITVNFTSPQDSRQFNITQKASSWDSQALLSNFVASAHDAYKTYQQAGRTVYLLGNNTATWVDSGIWYTVDGNSSLSSSQLLALAGSM